MLHHLALTSLQSVAQPVTRRSQEDMYGCLQAFLHAFEQNFLRIEFLLLDTLTIRLWGHVPCAQA